MRTLWRKTQCQGRLAAILAIYTDCGTGRLGNKLDAAIGLCQFHLRQRLWLVRQNRNDVRPGVVAAQPMVATVEAVSIRRR